MKSLRSKQALLLVATGVYIWMHVCIYQFHRSFYACLLSPNSCISLLASCCVMLLFFVLFTKGLLSRMICVHWLSSLLLPYCFRIPGAALVINDADAGNILFLGPWTKNAAIGNTTPWSTKASFYAASWRCSSLRSVIAASPHGIRITFAKHVLFS